MKIVQMADEYTSLRPSKMDNGNDLDGASGNVRKRKPGRDRRGPRDRQDRRDRRNYWATMPRSQRDMYNHQRKEKRKKLTEDQLYERKEDKKRKYRENKAKLMEEHRQHQEMKRLQDLRQQIEEDQMRERGIVIAPLPPLQGESVEIEKELPLAMEMEMGMEIEMDVSTGPQQNEGTYQCGQIRRYNTTKAAYEEWEPLMCRDRCRANGLELDMTDLIELKFNRGGSIVYYPQMLTEERRKALALDCRMLEPEYRQYNLGTPFEPRVHVLLQKSEDCLLGLGYQYHGVAMKAQPIESCAEICSLCSDLATQFDLPDRKWNIGCDAIAYRSQSDSIGYHADDNQDETIVLTVIPESTIVRPVHFRPKIKEKPLHDGDEEVVLYARQGDGCKYVFTCSYSLSYILATYFVLHALVM